KGVPLSESGRTITVYSTPNASTSVISLRSTASAADSVRSQSVPHRVAMTEAVTRTPEFAPMKAPFRTTMRKPEKTKHTFNSEKPWKHLIVSGTINETERKRYGALWAANRGILLPDGLRDCIHGFVVRKIWERSKLSRETLEKIWNLVSREREFYLTEDEFLVGMWIIDQCLYGRKLPLQLSPEVWSGVSRLGVRLRTSKHGQPYHHYHHHSHRH
ncbi:hypothetical protein V1512DRAFT_260229, partial [Lipomyces arxii]|uniref:uncharacterized protein n=1 Tax=Lipomyces arxii TaxID=56418 RepID=UPI0034CD286B